MRHAKLFVIASSCMVVASIALVASGCEGVPDIRFDDRDASDAGTQDAGDARDDRSSGDTGTDVGPAICPTAIPSNADGCCAGSATPCLGGSSGKSCEQACSKCGSCTTTEYCCTQGAGRCVAPGSTCP
jgi:hypothetical protein